LTSHPRPFRRRWTVAAAIAIICALALLGVNQRKPPEPIRIGVLHSLTGTMATSEAPLVAAVSVAVDEINASGGVLGRPIEILVADTRSSASAAALEAKRLITEQQVVALFGCWTSACRKAVKPVVEDLRHLLFYPVQYEGLELSNNIVYLGAAPNQQTIPGTLWAIEKFGQKVALVGSDYVFPRMSNAIVKDFISSQGGSVVSEQYLKLGTQDVAAVIEALVSKRPSVVINTLNGDTNAAFFAALVKARLNDLPVISLSVAETELAAWKGGALNQHYTVWSYLQSLPGPANADFVAAIRKRLGPAAAVTDPMETSYAAVKLWASAANAMKTTEVERLGIEVLHQSVPVPSGIAALDPDTRHLWRKVRIAKVEPDGQLTEVYASETYLRPNPWPQTRSRAEWESALAANP
jgi:urea transport system substrate-binding protein